MTPSKIAFGGGCHWCTEAVFQALKGVLAVEQGFVASHPPNDGFSEAVLLYYNPAVISLLHLARVHLHTHHSMANHPLRDKYRSAIYFTEPGEAAALREILSTLQEEFGQPLITQILPFKAFRPSEEQFQDYFRSDPGKPFCQRYIVPKLEFMRVVFPDLLAEPGAVQ